MTNPFLKTTILHGNDTILRNKLCFFCSIVDISKFKFYYPINKTLSSPQKTKTARRLDCPPMLPVTRLCFELCVLRKLNANLFPHLVLDVSDAETLAMWHRFGFQFTRADTQAGFLRLVPQTAAVQEVERMSCLGEWELLTRSINICQRSGAPEVVQLPAGDEIYRKL